jgi:Tfp pilus assembly protein PilN
MKHFNFVRTLSYKAQRSLARWYVISWILIISVFVIVIILQVPQLMYLQSLYKKQAALDNATQQLAHLTCQLEGLTRRSKQAHKQLMRLQALSSWSDKPLRYLQAISDKMSDDAYLSSFTVEPTATLILKGRTRGQEPLTNFIQQLTNSSIMHNVKLVELQHHENKHTHEQEIIFSIKAQGY